MAKHKIDLLCQHIKIVENSAKGVLNTLSNKFIHDIEDGLEYYAAESVQCKCIITEDVEGFYFAEIEVVNCQEFFKRYLLQEKG
ncbi:hypothetical protein ASE92_04160 [Pedobacter sp. Leaf41]|uniref:hypothetical protein n=1 Tax=Pedobacter sp. Leaf41 TaxID=1736218 RepID=UPI000702DBB4|nr:hypothetical protein [Pedobacter sp. Leaf41]KQN38628.1 hypothetical protein ASE92_04160 [Pedobacter sp. Leaf41]